VVIKILFLLQDEILAFLQEFSNGDRAFLAKLAQLLQAARKLLLICFRRIP